MFHLRHRCSAPLRKYYGKTKTKCFPESHLLYNRRGFSLYALSIFVFFLLFMSVSQGDEEPLSAQPMDEVKAAGKAAIWPYFVFYANERQDSKEPVPKSVTSFMEGNTCFLKAMYLTKDTELKVEIDKDESNHREGVIKVAALISSGLDAVKDIDTDQLNKILLGWGDQAREYIEDMRMFHDSLDKRTIDHLSDSVAKIEQWGKWLENNRQSLFEILKKKYEYAPPI